MRTWTFRLALALCAFLAQATGEVRAQTKYQANLNNCRAGAPACDLEWLRADDREEIDSRRNIHSTFGRDANSYDLRAEAQGVPIHASAPELYARNLTLCANAIAGCNLSQLTANDIRFVQDASYNRNLAACRLRHSSCNPAEVRDEDVLEEPVSGQLAYQRNLSACANELRSCDLSRVSNADRQFVAQAIQARNAAACRFGHSSCRPGPVRSWSLETGPSRQAPPPIPLPRSPSTPAPGCAENGSCYGDISSTTFRPKTVHVPGYYRSDGTYVRGHYRSAPRRK